MVSSVASSRRLARRRILGLRATATTGRSSLSSALTGFVAGMALPGAPDRVAAGLPAAALGTVAIGALVAGPAGGLGSVLAIAGSVAAIRRGAPGRRAMATERALPGVLDSIARHLRSGSSLAQAILGARPPANAADLRATWERLANLVPVVGVTAALDDWSARSGEAVVSVRLAVAALGLAATTGGSPARAIDGVAATLRSRLAVGEEVRALSSQARASAAVIAAAPIAFGLVASTTDRRTARFLASPSGLVLLALGISLDVLGAWWMARLCRASAG